MCIVYPRTNSENLYNLRVHTLHVRCTYRWQACRANRTNKEHDYSNWSQLFRLPQFPWISTLVKRKCGNRVRKTVRSSSAIAPKKKQSPLLPLKASSWQAEVNNEPRAAVKRNRKLNALFFLRSFLDVDLLIEITVSLSFFLHNSLFSQVFFSSVPYIYCGVSWQHPIDECTYLIKVHDFSI